MINNKKLVFTASSDTKIKIWKAENNHFKCIDTFTKHDSEVNKLVLINSKKEEILSSS